MEARLGKITLQKTPQLSANTTIYTPTFDRTQINFYFFIKNVLNEKHFVYFCAEFINKKDQ